MLLGESTLSHGFLVFEEPSSEELLLEETGQIAYYTPTKRKGVSGYSPANPSGYWLPDLGSNQGPTD